VRSCDSAARRLAKVAGMGGVFLVLGGVVIWLLSPLGWVLVLLGVALLVYGPLLIAWSASGSARKPDHKVEGRTFVTDLFRSVKQPPESRPRTPRERDHPPR
jgi:hypothetical protein